MARKFTNVETYLMILFLFALLAIGIARLGLDLLQNDNAAFDNDSIEYIANLQGVDVSDYQATQQDVESPILITANQSQGNPKDFGLEFLLSKEKGFGIELVIKRIFSLPSFIIVDLLRFQLNDWKWVIDIVGWILTLLIIITLVNFARNK